MARGCFLARTMARTLAIPEQFSPDFGLIFPTKSRRKPGEKGQNPLETKKKNPVETAPRNSRLLSLVVAKRVPANRALAILD